VALQHEIAIADHRGEEIVEVVRDPARELADGLHLLRLVDLALKMALLGRIEAEEDEKRLAVDADAREIGRDHPRRPAARHEVDGGNVRLARERVAQQLGEAVAALPGEQVADAGAAQLAAIAAEKLAERLVAAPDRTRGVDERQADRRVVEQALKAL